MQVSIPAGIIKALLITAPKTDVRFYLNGALLEIRERHATLIATDGHMLLAVPLPADAIEGERMVGDYIIPRSLLESVKPAKVGRTVLPLVLEVTAATGAQGQTVYTLTLKGATHGMCAPVDGRFPDWRRVMPEKASGESVQFDARLVARFGDIFDALGGSKKYCAPVIHYNGVNAALVSNLGHGALGVIMPLRDKTPAHPGVPAWAKQPQTPNP
jgi:DNA polymerase-3 subunit beta